MAQIRAVGKRVGDVINELIAEFGQDTIGLYMLEEALGRACFPNSRADVFVNGEPVCETTRYQELKAQQDKVWDTLKEKWAQEESEFDEV